MLVKKQHFLFILFINYILCSFFLNNEKIEELDRGDIKSININTVEDYLNYIKNYNYIISLFHVDWCGHCQEFLPVLDKASSYKILNKNWVFLKINCSKYPHICSYLGVQRYPTIRIYKKNELLYIEPPRDLVPLIKLLLKLSSNPLIKIESKEEFIKKCGEFCPIIEVLPKNKENEKESEFYECIKNLANKELIQTFYFGIIESKDNIEKIIFNYSISNISYIWDGNCQNAYSFLYDNKYPLLSKINSYFLKEIAEDPRILIFLITFLQNKRINNFIFSSFQKLSFENRKYIFGYADYSEDKDLSKFFNLKLNNTNEIKIIIYDFNERMYYIHNETYNIEINNEKVIYNNIENLIKNINNLKYTTGSKIKDWIGKIGFEKMSTNKQIIVVGLLVFFLLGIIFICSFFSGCNESDLDEDDEDENELEEDLDNDKKNKEEINKKGNDLNKNISEKKKIE